MSAETAKSSDKAKPIKPRDAATLIMVDTTSGAAKVLLGKRRMDMKFMPGKYVFPGGRVDPTDKGVDCNGDLGGDEIAKLLVDMKGKPSPDRARSLALAAIRETYEEAGLVIGTPVATGEAKTNGRTAAPSESWQRFFDLGFVPHLAPIIFFARAITPPGRPRRFDTRFFCVDAGAIAFQSKPPEDELSDLVWMRIEEARALDLPPITRVILEDLGDRLKQGPLQPIEAPVPYYYRRNGVFRRDLISATGQEFGLRPEPST